MIGLECLVGYGCGRWMDTGSNKQRKAVLVLGVLVIVALLFWFKYFNFFAGIFLEITGLDWMVKTILLPIGISFYTFQILSYLADVYTHQAPVQRSLIRFSLYVCMFFQLIAGPIVRYSEIESQLDAAQRTLSWHQTAKGSAKFVCGLAKKVLIANQLSSLNVFFRSVSNPSVLFYWLNALAVTLFIYYDFSGYSDMAIGLGQMMGFHLPENFDYPFLAGNFTGFWRHWHMTLTRWFRDYVYIPLGGNRKGKPRQIFNLLVVWLLTGLWHGAAWNFVLWGLLFFGLLVLEKFVIPTAWQQTLWYRILFIIGILISFVLFYDDSLALFTADLQAMFGLAGLPFSNGVTVYTLLSNLVLLTMAAAGCFPFWKQKYHQLENNRHFALASPIGMALVLVVCIAWLAAGTFNPFLYFRF
ncbi:MBOAT family protein [Erysipelotrichaceae bacterium RD49]|nr:MBOAT family protein [Erysipelotrichaceae bacterium RD49]